MTYPDPTLQSFLDDHFVFFQIDVSLRDESLRDLFREIKPTWAPLFRATTGRGIELRRWFGFLPPGDLILELEIVLAHDLMLQKRDREAFERLELAIRDEGRLPALAEATFWKGVAAFKAGDGDFEALERIWSELADRWPESTWAIRADVLDMLSG